VFGDKDWSNVYKMYSKGDDTVPCGTMARTGDMFESSNLKKKNKQKK